jgi:hypothetical protein
MVGPSKAQSYRATLQKFGGSLGTAWEVENQKNGRFSWCVFIAGESRPPTQGWKIHISAAASDINDLIHRVLPRLVELKTSFKIPATLEGIIQINS